MIGSDNGLSPARRHAIIWTNAGILLIGPLGTNFIDILIEIHTFSFKKMQLKMSSWKLLPFRLSLNVLRQCSPVIWSYTQLWYLSCSYLDLSQMVSSAESCDLIGDINFFGDCTVYIIPGPYRENCRADTCAMGPDFSASILCNYLAAYARQCVKAHFQVNWLVGEVADICNGKEPEG